VQASASTGWRVRIERLARVGVLPTDSRDEALRKETLVLAASVITALAVVWVATYWALGLYWSAAIPFAYLRAADVVITMGCGDACPIYPGKRYLDWDLPDPAGKSLEEVEVIRDEIDRKVRDLLEGLVPEA
jgi:hypothetical protein